MRNRRFPVFAFALAGLLSLSSDASASGMQCGSRLVSKGDSMYRVRSLCGEPDDARRRTETHTERRRVRVPCGQASDRGKCERTVEHSVDVVVDEWIYDLGAQRFMRHLTFVDGTLWKVETGGYGTRAER